MPASVIITPNMNLPNPVATIDIGPDYAFNLEQSLNVIDLHNHTPGNGVQIPSNGLNINANLSFNNFSATGLSAITFQPQTSFATINSAYVSGVDLYYNDGNGNSIQLTSGGSVNATSSGISSGTNTASFVSNVLVVNAASNTPANIQGASILLGNNSSGSKFLTLSPPAAMAANITETLPTIPAATSFMTMNSTGGMAASIATSAGITGANIAATTIAASNIISGTITTTQISNSAGITGSQLSSTAGIVGTQIANQTIALNNLVGTSQLNATGSTYSNSTTNFTTIVSQSFFLTVNAPERPIFFSFSGRSLNIVSTSTSNVIFQIIDTTDNIVLATTTISVNAGVTTSLAPGSLNWSGTISGASATATYALQAKSSASGGSIATNGGGVTMNMFQV